MNSIKVTDYLFIFTTTRVVINPLNSELNPICHLLALLGAHHIFHVSGLRVNEITYIPCRSLVLTAVTARFIQSSTPYSNCSMLHKTTLWTKYSLSPVHNPVFSNMTLYAVVMNANKCNS